MGETVVIPGDALGWETFRRVLARCAATPFGRDRALTLVPSPKLTDVQEGLRETREARWARAGEGEPPWQGITDVRPALAEATPEGAVLDGRVLAALGLTLAAVDRLVAYGARVDAGAASLGARLRQLPRSSQLAASLAHALEPDGRLRDEASPRLGAIRRQIERLRATLQARLEALLASPSLAAALQDRYVTLRNGRYVVPVRHDARRAIRGIVHDRSASGATLFVEPDAAIDLNNQLTQRALEEHEEERRLLGDLTRQVRDHLGELHGLVDGVGVLDLAFARAALADRLDACEPDVSAAGDITLRGARHPLLVAQRWGGGPPIVPVDLVVPADQPGLLITGPNAGGKTVALETVGLLALMAQAGCHIPADTGSRLPIFDEVLAVIGDEQSLAQDLSTFSSFVRQAREILGRATARSLVLLDELGAGTDPAEGAALGAALVEALLDRGARVVATTHLEPLKVFAQTEPRCRNASVAFDPERLEPTFRIEYGRPGPSYALTLGERLGLPAPLIARARAHLGEERRRLEDLLAHLQAREREVEARMAEATRREAEARQTAVETHETLARAAHDAARVRRDAQAEAQAVLAQARRQVGQELERLKSAEQTRRRAQEAYHRLRAAEAEVLSPPDREPGPVAGEVQLRGLGLRGRVVAEDAEGLTVQAGSLTVRVPRTAVEAATAGPSVPRAATVSVPTRADVPRELYLLGQTTDEAQAAVEKFLDDAVLAGHGTVRLVHGKGTGALRRTLAIYLRRHPLVSDFRLAEPAEGGGGVTVVDLVEGHAE